MDDANNNIFSFKTLKTKQIFTCLYNSILFKCLLKVQVIVFTDQDFPNFKNELLLPKNVSFLQTSVFSF